MRQEEFEQLHRDHWQTLSEMLTVLESGAAAARAQGGKLRHFPGVYRMACQHLAQAQARGYGLNLVEYLNDLVLRGHHQLYRPQNALGDRMLRFVFAGFPQLVRAEKRFVLAAIVLFVLPGLAAYIAIHQDPNLIFSLFNPVQVNHFESMYNPAHLHLGTDRSADTDLQMFGYYIMHNISIAFRCFASGLLFLVGSVYELAYNGLILGGLAAHMQNIDYRQTFFPFVIGHSAFELTAICLSGAAGMRLGAAVLVPGNQRRLDALLAAAKVGVRLLYGVMGMLLIAAFIEAFWSSDNAISAGFHLAAGVFLWSAVLLYFLLGGRGRAI